MNRRVLINEISKLNASSFKKNDFPPLIYYLDTGNLTKNRIDELQKLNVLSDKIPSRARRKVKRHTILYSTVRPNKEHYGFIEDDYESLVVSTGFTTIDIIDRKISPKYIYYALTQKHITEYLHTIGTNSVSAYPSISSEDIGSLELLVPESKIKQEKIAYLLSTIDAKININNKINAELESMAKLIYEYWFVQFDFPDENGKPYKSSGGKMAYNEELKREIPDGWVLEHLEQLIDIYDSERIPLSKSEREKRKGTYPYFGATGILDYIDDFIFDGEYILLAEDGSVMNEEGYPIVQFIWGKTWVNNHAHVIRAKKEELNEYIFQALSRIPVVLIKSGSIQMKINQRNLLSFSIVKPPEHLMLKYSDNVKAFRKMMMKNIDENQQLAELRDWLLPMLMNGQITIKD